MTDISEALPADLYKRLQTLSVKSGQTIERCLELAVSEYIDNYEDACKTDLNSVSSLERSFFFSAAE